MGKDGSDNAAPGDGNGNDDTALDAGGDWREDADANSSEDIGREERVVPPTCGNGTLDEGEECDEGAANSDTRPDACRRSCLAPACGDGVVDRGERCDDGNRLDGDGCPASCFPPEEAPAVLVGDPVATDDGFDAGGIPRVAWNGTGWGVAWGQGGAHQGLARFAALDADAHLLAPAATLPIVGEVSDLEWQDDGYGIAFEAGWRDTQSGVALLDAAGAVRSGPSWPLSSGEGIDLGWAPSIDAWVISYIGYNEGGEGGPVHAVAMNRFAGFLGAPVTVSATSDARNPLAVPTDARIVVAWADDAGIWYRGVSWPDMSGEPPAQLLANALPIPDARLGGTHYRTRTVIAWGDAERIRVAVLDGWSLEKMQEPAAVGDSSFGDVWPGLVAVPERGYLGVCYCAGSGHTGGDGSDQDRVMLRIIRPDGAPVGSEVTVKDGMHNAAGCAISWSGTEFVVAYWKAGGDRVYNQIFAQRVLPSI